MGAHASTWVQRMLAFLGDPASYEPRPDSVQIVQTHASMVAIAGQHVYKVKKPVNFGFLDYSTLDRRRHFCHREVALNRRLCREVYVGVLPIVDRGGRLGFGREGEPPADYAVHMRRLDERYLLSTMLQREEASATQLRRAIDVLVPFYRDQPPAPAESGAGSIPWIREVVLGNLDVCRDAVGQVLSEAAYGALRRYSEGFIATRDELLAERVAAGRIKDCHGDLRPMHIHLAPDRVSIYDCIEFNDHLRCIDVLCDVAFLSMELAYAGRWDLGENMLAEICEALSDRQDSKLAEFYQCYRAAVRGKVAWLLAGEPEIGADRASAAAAEARAYFQLALRYAIFGSRPIVLCVMGQVGTGKSTLADCIGDALGWPVFSSDRVRKELAGLPLFDRLSVEFREELYGRAMSARTYAKLADLARKALSERRGAIIDATFGRRADREQVRQAIGDAGGLVVFALLTASKETRRQRLASRERLTSVLSDARLEDLAQLDSAWESPAELLPKQAVVVDSSGSSADALGAALEQLIQLSSRLE